uniref:Uncharacterized protein n=1 Tax=Anguilla anguilla TaxID=7936 RepID=A0A0E9UQC8_ANGAN
MAKSITLSIPLRYPDQFWIDQLGGEDPPLAFPARRQCRSPVLGTWSCTAGLIL